jgi:hypothetical protein
LKATSESGIARLLTHIRDCGAVFDRIVVHWPVHTEMSRFVRPWMDYEDNNWFKPDKIWLKAAKKFCLGSFERTTECFRLELAILALLSQAAYQANEPFCYFDP